ncbi:hypothetical protein SKAU_G00073020 [Synaphobranchus kaupii]|uniref:Uncharacterized protein n=1 Tax=Synaphobranchus kaupii TaxID=118154 RepID=A0A9Q1G876_SYNKA|nr:hypothetical protein SKAU_G00073020 [Synaphobranchus kaupii]
MFKQFLQASALQFVQIDSCRLGSVNENLAVLLMACKFQGGVGLCELVQHLILFDYISVSTSLHNPIVHKRYPDPGYSTEMLEESMSRYQYPQGEAWQGHTQS